MPIRVKCESCKKTLSVKDHLAGKKIKCPVCQNVVAIPAASPTKEAAPSAAPAAPKKDAPTKKPPAPTAKPAPAPAAKKPPAATKQAEKTKPTVEKPESNGKPAPKSNGQAPKPPEPEPIELPPENVEAEALAAFADEPKPVEQTEEPKTIDFICDWCDEKVSLPIEMAGKQTQCPNQECGRIIKVPLPKKVEKKDWRKMDKPGSVLAKINQPEQLENAWGTEEATKARQDSLKQAGAIEEPPKKKRDIYDLLRWACYAGCVLAFVGVVFAGFWKMAGTRRQQVTIEEVSRLVIPPATAKLKTPSLPAAETYRTIAMLYQQSNKRDRADKAMGYFQGAGNAAKFSATKSFEGVNEQLFLPDVAIWQIDMGEEDAKIFDGANLSWHETQAEIGKTLGKITAPEVQVIALREVGARLIEKQKTEIAVGLTAAFSSDAKGKRIPYRQQIAFRVASAKDPANLPKDLPPIDPKHKLFDGNARVGYAEGYAWTDRFDEAMKLVQLPGTNVRDRLDAAIGVAAVANARKKKDKAAEFVDEAFRILGEKRAMESADDWQKLLLIKLAARTDKTTTAAPLFKLLPREFQLRAHLEVFLAYCDAAPSMLEGDSLTEQLARIEEVDIPEKKASAKQESTAGNTLALAWLAVARHNAALGGSRDANRKLFDDRLKIWTPPPGIDVEVLRAVVDVGTYQGTKK